MWNIDVRGPPVRQDRRWQGIMPLFGKGNHRLDIIGILTSRNYLICMDITIIMINFTCQNIGISTI